MLKLRKPFSQKIHLHIKQDMLQGLWDKYVPASAPEYEQIQLIYLNQEYGQEDGQPKQIRLLISFALQNRMMRMGLEKYPSSLAFVVNRMECSLRRVEKYYLTQLKSSNFSMFRTLNQYMAVLEREELENRRYRDWQKEHTAIEKQWEEYRALSLFSVRVKEFLEERSRQMARTLARDLLVSLTETEFQALAEKSVWQKKDELIAYLKTCDRAVRRQIVERLKEETELCRALALKTGVSETGRKEKKDKREKDPGDRFVRDRLTKIKFSGKKYAKIRQEKEEIALEQILQSVPGQSAGEKLAKAADLFEPKEFWLFCRQVIDLETVNSQIAIFQKDREEILSYISQADTEQLQRLWTQVDTVYPEKMTRLQEQYHRELIRDFHAQVDAMVREQPFEEIADAVHTAKPFEEIADMAYAAEPGYQAEPGMAEDLSVEYVPEESGGQGFSENILRFVKNIEHTQEMWKERIRLREAQAFETYRELYQEVLEDKISRIRRQDMEQLVEETFRNQQRENIYQESITEEEIRNICEWGRIFLESMGMEYRAEAQDTEYQEELEYLLEHVSHYMESQDIYGETDILALGRSRLEEGKAEELKNLLTYIHTLKEEQKEDFVRQLADAVVIWQQVVSGESIEEISADTFDELRQERLRTAAEQAEAKQLVEKALLKRFKENVYGETITEEEIQSICEWGRVFLESVDTEYRTETADTNHRMEVETADREPDRGSLPIGTEYQEELAYLIERVSQRIERQSIYGETNILAFNKERLEEGKAEELKNLLTYTHTLKERQREEFIRQLADAVVLWQQAVSMESIEEISADASGMLRKEMSADAFGLLKRERLQTAAGQKETGQFVEEAFWKRHKANIYREDITKEEIRSICEWGRIFLESVDTEYRAGTAETRLRTETVMMEPQKEALDREYPAESANIKSFDVEPEYQEELAYLIGQVNRHMEKQDVYGETNIFTLSKNQLEEEKEISLKNLLTYIHTLQEEQKEVFVRQLADAVVLWQQAYTAGKSLKGISADDFPVLKQESIQTEAKQVEAKQVDAKQLVERVFLKRYKENIYQENITEEEIRSICEWGRVFLEYVDAERWTEITGTSRTEASDTKRMAESRMIDSVYLEHREEWVRLIRQINHRIEEKSMHGENIMLSWKESQLEEEKAEELLIHIHGLKEEQRTKLVQQLADAVLIWRQMDILAHSFAETSADVFSALEQEAFPAEQKEEKQSADKIFNSQPAQAQDMQFAQAQGLQPAGAEKAGVPYQELWEWGEALLFYPEQEWEDADILPVQGLGGGSGAKSESGREGGDILPVQRQEELSFSQDGYQEDIQTQIIRRQIEAAKDRNNLQRLVMQVNHQIESSQKAESLGTTLQTEEVFQLVYTDSKLKSSPIQRLVRHIRTLDEKEYGILVEELSQVVRQQWLSYSGQAGTAEVLDKQKKIGEVLGKQKEMSLETEEDLPDAILEHLEYHPKQKEEEHEKYEVPRKEPLMGHIQEEQLAAAYPGLAWGIQEYERQRRLMVQRYLQKLALYPSYESSARMLQNSENGQETAFPGGMFFGSYREGSEQFPDLMALGNYWEGDGQRPGMAPMENPLERGGQRPGMAPMENPWESGGLQQELQYSIQKDYASNEEQLKTEMRMRRENSQIKSAQEQLDRKLKEVEEELKKVESSAKAKEDVNMLAEQVKKQLYEELHVERLRRGLA